MSAKITVSKLERTLRNGYPFFGKRKLLLKQLLLQVLMKLIRIIMMMITIMIKIILLFMKGMLHSHFQSFKTGKDCTRDCCLKCVQFGIKFYSLQRKKNIEIFHLLFCI